MKMTQDDSTEGTALHFIVNAIWACPWLFGGRIIKNSITQPPLYAAVP